MTTTYHTASTLGNVLGVTTILVVSLALLLFLHWSFYTKGRLAKVASVLAILGVTAFSCYQIAFPADSITTSQIEATYDVKVTLLDRDHVRIDDHGTICNCVLQYTKGAPQHQDILGSKGIQTAILLCDGTEPVRK